MGYYDTKPRPVLRGWGYRHRKLAGALVGVLGAALIITWVLVGG